MTRATIMQGKTRTAAANALLAALLAAVLAGVATSSSCAPPDTSTKTKLVHVGLSVDGLGRVVSAPTALDCGTACAGDFPAGTHLTLQARADAGSLFGGWDGDCLGEDGPVVDRDLTEDLVCVAHFVAAPPPPPPSMHTLTVVALGPGRVEATPDAADAAAEALTCRDETCRGNFTENTVVGVAAFADPGSEVVGFSGDCEGLSSTAGQVTMDADRVCTVSFFSQGDVTYPLRVLVVGDGRVDVTPGNLGCTSADLDCEARYEGGTVVTMTASPPAGGGASFRAWGQACAGLTTSATLSIEIDFGVACSAIFDRSVQLDVIGQGTIAAPGRSCSSSCSVSADGPIDVVATPDAGYAFGGWSGDCSGADATTTVSVSAHACTATFVKIPPTLTVVVAGAGAVTSSDEELATAIDCPSGACASDVINHPALVDPDPQAWTCSAIQQGNGLFCNCGCGVVDSDCASPALSACQLFTGCDRDHVVEDHNNLCYVEPHGGVPQVTLTAAASPGATFTGWSGACAGAEPVVTVDVPEAVTCTATFTP